MIGEIIGEIKGYCQVVSSPQHTTNVFGGMDVVAGKELRVIDRSVRGDCLCLLPDGNGLVDVDSRDVMSFRAHQQPVSPTALLTLAAMAAKKSKETP